MIRTRTPQVSNARVISVDVPNRRLVVTLPSAQIVTVRTSHEGLADGLRVNHKSLPLRGTEGIVVFPSGDNRNGIWLKSIYVQGMDALTTNTDQFLDYDSHWSGHFHLLDQFGNFTESFADGTFLQVGSGTTVPATFRHTIDQQQNRQTTPLPQNQRVPNPPAPFNLTFKHITGTTVAVDPSGNVTATGAAGAALTHSFGGTTLQIDKSGNVTANGAQGATLTFSFGGTTMSIGSNGVSINGVLLVSGEVTAGSGTGDSVGLMTHKHGTGSPAAGTSAPSPGT
jgi:hypothetical protein